MALIPVASSITHWMSHHFLLSLFIGLVLAVIAIKFINRLYNAIERKLFPVNYFITRTYSSKADVSKAAMDELVKLGDRKAIKAIKKQLTDTDEGVRDTAITALNKFGITSERIVNYYISILNKPFDRENKIWAPHFLKERKIAFYEIGRSKDKRAFEYLTKGLDDSEFFYEAATGLGTLGDKEAIPSLIKKLDIPNLTSYMFNPIYASLKRLGISEQESMDIYLRILAGQNTEMRRLAINGLVQLNDTNVVPVLIKNLNDQDASIRALIVSGLGNMRNKRALPQLIEKLDDSAFCVVQAAVLALGKLEDETAIPYLMRKLEGPKLCDFITARNQETKTSEEYLSAVNKYTAHSGFYDDIASSLEKLKVPKEEMLEIYIRLLNSDIVAARTFAITRLGTSGDKRALPCIIQGLNDPEEVVCRKAAYAAGEYGDKAAIPYLIKKLEGTDVSDIYDYAVVLEKFKDEEQVQNNPTMKIVKAIQEKAPEISLYEALKLKEDASQMLSCKGDFKMKKIITGSTDYDGSYYDESYWIVVEPDGKASRKTWRRWG